MCYEIKNPYISSFFNSLTPVVSDGRKSVINLYGMVVIVEKCFGLNKQSFDNEQLFLRLHPPAALFQLFIVYVYDK